MRIAVAITCHNQHQMVKQTIGMLCAGTIRPSVIYVLSDAKPFWKLPGEPEMVIPINNFGKHVGRCGNRNSVVDKFFYSDCDALVFMDGDCYPDSQTFVERYSMLLNNHDLVFGTRRHDDVTGLSLPPSDLLTANMDNLWAGNLVDYNDLRLVSGAIDAWKSSRTFSERLDLMLTGMVAWSCNFGFSKRGLQKLRTFQRNTYGLEEGIFDSEAFGDGWGYEDVAMGLDALYAGLDIDITDSVKVGHRSHDRSDGLFDHIKGRHAIMERARMLDRYAASKSKTLGETLLAAVFFLGGILATVAIQCL